MKINLKLILIKESTLKWMLLALIGIGMSLGFNESPAREAMTPGKAKPVPIRYALKLPNYCYYQYFGRTEPQYRFPKGCGPSMNHFCGGLVALLRARDSLDKKWKRHYYRLAEKEIGYTKRGIEQYPQCPLHPVVNQTYMEAKSGLRIYGP